MSDKIWKQVNLFSCNYVNQSHVMCPLLYRHSWTSHKKTTFFSVLLHPRHFVNFSFSLSFSISEFYLPHFISFCALCNASLLPPHLSSPLFSPVRHSLIVTFHFSGKLCEHVEEPVIAGFLNAFAVFLVKSQVLKSWQDWIALNK